MNRLKHWIKYGLAGILCFCLIFGNIGWLSSVYGVEYMDMVELGTKQDEDEDKEKDKEERPTHDKQGRPILSEGAVGILIDGKSGNVLFESQSDKKMFPASTTKVMTALLTLEAVEKQKISLDQKVTITEAMLKDITWDSSSMALQEGEIISVRNLLYGLMIPSGNDAAMALAYTVSGSSAEFVNLMNRRAKALGLTNTKFKNPHGLHHEDHYTTAKEMAQIAYQAMKNPIFREIAEIAHIKIPPTNKTEEERYYINTNGLVSTMRYSQFYYEGANGIKTGYTTEAGNCLVASAKRGNAELIAVLFHGEGIENSHNDCARMLDYGFSAFESIAVVREGQILDEVKVKWGRGKESVTTSAVAPVWVLVPLGTDVDELEVKTVLPKFVKAPVLQKDIVGTVKVSLKGKVIGEGKVCADLTVKRSFLWPLYAFLEWLWGFLLIRIICYLFLIILGGIALIILNYIWQECHRVWRRNKRRR